MSIVAHRVIRSGSLAEWSQLREAVLGDAHPAQPPDSRVGGGPPHVRLVDVSDAARWYGRVRNRIAHTWALCDGGGAQVAVSAWAFPTAVMAERDARTIQEFVDQLTLHFPVAGGDKVNWYGQWEDMPALLSSSAHSSQEDAVRAATIAVGLLPVATVAAYAVDAMPELTRS